MASTPEGTADWEAVLRAQGVSEEMIAEARRSAAVMVDTAAGLVTDPREPIAPDAFARQLAALARPESETYS